MLLASLIFRFVLRFADPMRHRGRQVDTNTSGTVITSSTSSLEDVI